MLSSPFALGALVVLRCLASAPDCTLVTIGATPLSDLGPSEYLAGFAGGLYPGGASVRPELHEGQGVVLATGTVLPRGADGSPDPVDGLIGMISVGMSNSSQEFDGGSQTFKPRADADPTKNPHVVIVNGAQGGQPATAWTDPASSVWGVLADRIATEGLSAPQVQVAWIKQALAGPAGHGAFPSHAEDLRAALGEIVRNLRTLYPNLRLAFLSSRTRAYTDQAFGLNPEPFAYESGFAVRSLIGDQIAGAPGLDFGARGSAPWLGWGPYLWADGPGSCSAFEGCARSLKSVLVRA